MKSKTFSTPLFLLFILISLCFSKLNAQNVAINSTGSAANSSAMLDVQSSTKGLLIPQVSLTSPGAAAPLTSPANSLLVYNTNASLNGGKGYYYNAGTSGTPNWIKLVTVDSTGTVMSMEPGGVVVKLERAPMGELSMNGNTTITNISSANTWVKAQGTTTASALNYQFSNGGVNNRLVYTGPSEKMFHIACTLSVKATVSNSNLKAVIYKNGVALTAGIVQTKMGSSSDIVSTAIHVAINLNTGDYLELWITNTIGSDDFTITEMNLFAMGMSMGMD
jgi:hypothetical protein